VRSLTSRAAWAVAVTASVSIALVAALRRVEAVEVRGSSMAPHLQPGDRLLAVRLGRGRAVRTGDIVLAADPRSPRRELVKRVSAIGASGVQLRGDNQGATTDSAVVGPVASSAIRWRVVARYWPPGRIGPV
jgi:nickel-type superoxide dismutase maturation protease